MTLTLSYMSKTNQILSKRKLDTKIASSLCITNKALTHRYLKLVLVFAQTNVSYVSSIYSQINYHA